MYETQKPDSETVYLIQPIDKSKHYDRDIDDIVAEAEGLSRAISFSVIKTQRVPYTKIQAGSFFGSGVRENIKSDIDDLNPSVIVVNTALSPVQQRNLEKEWNAKVIDRTGLILEIFGARAQTKEGKLQVDLAMLAYQRSRLVRSWTHLERQRGGAGFMGGPGERQIELDRRIISQKMVKLKKELEKVQGTRDLGRKSRQRIPLPVVSLVGYTNAGKSTLFNALTAADVFAEDLPFATLDPTMRRVTIGNRNCILSDTVGFISDLPTHLIMAFRGTLEQVTYANVIVHVIDASSADYDQQYRDVVDILTDLGIDYDNDDRVLEVYNKIDALCADGLQDLGRLISRHKDTREVVQVSATQREGLEVMQSAVSRILSQHHIEKTIRLNAAQGRARAWLHENAQVLSEETSECGIYTNMSCLISQRNLSRFEKQYSK